MSPDVERSASTLPIVDHSDHKAICSSCGCLTSSTPCGESTSGESKRVETLAGPPFDSPCADLKIRTSDHVVFRAHRIILSLASPFFRTMLSLPQPHPEIKDGGVDEKESCVVPVPEDSKVMRAVLLFCYPGRDPVFTDIDEIKGVVGAVMKYEMQDTIAGRLREAIHPFTCKEPLRIFSIASHFKWRELAQAAAKASLHFPLQEVYVQELELINAGDYHRLLKYHQQCGIAAANVTTNCGLRWMRLGAWTWLRCQSCPAASSTFMCITDSNLGAMPVPVRAWFMDYMVAMGVALKRTPSSRLLDSIDSIIPFIPKIGQCQTCRAGGFVEMRSFIPGIFKAEVERAIAQVEIEITF